MLKDGGGFMLEVFEPILHHPLWPGLSHKITHGGSTRWSGMIEEEL
jgi:hypothetical protein